MDTPYSRAIQGASGRNFCRQGGWKGTSSPETICRFHYLDLYRFIIVSLSETSTCESHWILNYTIFKKVLNLQRQ